MVSAMVAAIDMICQTVYHFLSSCSEMEDLIYRILLLQSLLPLPIQELAHLTRVLSRKLNTIPHDVL